MSPQRNTDEVLIPYELMDWAQGQKAQELFDEVVAKSGVDRIQFEQLRPGKAQLNIVGSNSEGRRAARCLLELHLQYQVEYQLAEQRRLKTQQDLDATILEFEQGKRVEFAVDENLLGLVIGKGGTNVQRVKEITGVDKIVVDAKSRLVRIKGHDPKAVQQARDMLEFRETVVPLQSHGRAIIGDRASGINEICRKTGCTSIRIEGNRMETPVLRIVGNKSSVALAEEMVRIRIEYEDQVAIEKKNEKEALRKLAHIDNNFGIGFHPRSNQSNWTQRRFLEQRNGSAVNGKHGQQQKHNSNNVGKQQTKMNLAQSHQSQGAGKDSRVSHQQRPKSANEQGVKLGNQSMKGRSQSQKPKNKEGKKSEKPNQVSQIAGKGTEASQAKGSNRLSNTKGNEQKRSSNGARTQNQQSNPKQMNANVPKGTSDLGNSVAVGATVKGSSGKPGGRNTRTRTQKMDSSQQPERKASNTTESQKPNQQKKDNNTEQARRIGRGGKSKQINTKAKGHNLPETAQIPQSQGHQQASGSTSKQQASQQQPKGKKKSNSKPQQNKATPPAAQQPRDEKGESDRKPTNAKVEKRENDSKQKNVKVEKKVNQPRGTTSGQSTAGVSKKQSSNAKNMVSGEKQSASPLTEAAVNSKKGKKKKQQQKKKVIQDQNKVNAMNVQKQDRKVKNLQSPGQPVAEHLE